MDQVWLRKIVRELAANRSRTALTVLSIAVGLFAVSLTFSTQAILSRNVLDSYAPTAPAAIVVQVLPVDPRIARTIRNLPGVRAVEGLNHISARARIGETWRALALWGVDDMTRMRVNRLAPDGGAWPAPRRTMLFERSYMDGAGVRIGDSLLIELEDGRRHQLSVAGSAQDLSVISGRLGSPVLHAYISLDTAESLTGSRQVNELMIAVAAFIHEIDRTQRTNRIIITTAQHDAAFHEQVARALEVHYAQDGIQALVQTQSDIRAQIAGFLSLILVLLLVMALSFVAIGALSLVGAMSLNVLERTKEIGILRAIGSAHRQVAGIVVIEGVCIGVLSWIPATLLALPLSKMLSDVIGWSILNWPLIYVFPPIAPLLWIGIVVLVSAGASYLPARHAGRVNVRDALEHQ